MQKLAHEIYFFDEFRLDLTRGALFRGLDELKLRPKSFDVLKYLTENQGRLVSKDELIESVWQGMAVTDDSLVQCLKDIRRALGDNEQQIIKTVPRRGYIFDKEVSENGALVYAEETAGVHLVLDELEYEVQPELSEATTSRVDYVPRGIKKHKRVLLIALMVLIALLPLAILGYKISFTPDSTAIASVAVLPFENGSMNPDFEYLSDGLSENLIDRLSLLPQLKVTSRSSSFKYKGKDVNLQDVANALGVQAIVTGRVFQKGDSLIVRVELTDVYNKTQLWGEQYARKASDIQTLQEEIIRSVSHKLRLKLTGEQEQQITKLASQNPEAYQLYLSGRYFLSKPDNQSCKRSIDYFYQAIALDPNFVWAYLAIAAAYENLAANNVLDPKEALPKAKAATLKAFELDSTFPYVYVGLGVIKKTEWDWQGAENDYRHAIELNPSQGHRNLAWLLSMLGRHDEALTEIKIFEEIYPMDMGGKDNEVFFLINARRYEEAARVLKNFVELEPNYNTAHIYFGYIYEMKGMYPEAIAEYQAFLNIDRDTGVSACLGGVLAKAGRPNEALKILHELKNSKMHVSPAQMSFLYIGLDDKESALALLEKAYDEHDIQLQFLNVDAHYDSLRNEPQFQEIVRKVFPPIS